MNFNASDERTASTFRPHNRLNKEAADSSEMLSDLPNYMALEEN
jgi:hypothetical protein